MTFSDLCSKVWYRLLPYILLLKCALESLICIHVRPESLVKCRLGLVDTRSLEVDCCGLRRSNFRNKLIFRPRAALDYPL